jgi:hypothetical protein
MGVQLASGGIEGYRIRLNGGHHDVQFNVLSHRLGC